MMITEKHIPWYFTPAVVIIAGCLVAMVNFGVRSSFGLFTAPISEARAWPREIFSFGLALQNLLWGIATPIAGAGSSRPHRAARKALLGLRHRNRFRLPRAIHFRPPRRRFDLRLWLGKSTLHTGRLHAAYPDFRAAPHGAE